MIYDLCIILTSFGVVKNNHVTLVICASINIQASCFCAPLIKIFSCPRKTSVRAHSPNRAVQRKLIYQPTTAPVLRQLRLLDLVFGSNIWSAIKLRKPVTMISLLEAREQGCFLYYQHVRYPKVLPHKCFDITCTSFFSLITRNYCCKQCDV